MAEEAVPATVAEPSKRKRTRTPGLKRRNYAAEHAKLEMRIGLAIEMLEVIDPAGGGSFPVVKMAIKLLRGETCQPKEE